MYKGGYQIIDLSDYVFEVVVGGGMPSSSSVTLDDSFIPMFLSKKVKLFTNISIDVNGSIFSDVDDFFAENTKTIVEGNTIRKYYHCHIDYATSDSGLSAYSNEMEVVINTLYNTIQMSMYYID